MKTTYLLKSVLPDGTAGLLEASYEEWLAVVDANKFLPPDRQRYFIVDCIPESQGVDRMVIESTAEEYRRWNRERMASARNRALGREYQMVSLDTPVRIEDTTLDLKEIVRSEDQVEERICFQMLSEELRKALAAWKPWGGDMLDCYLRGERRSCTDRLAAKYGVSSQVIRKYKRQFEEFIKIFLGGVSF